MCSVYDTSCFALKALNFHFHFEGDPLQRRCNDGAATSQPSGHYEYREAQSSLLLVLRPQSAMEFLNAKAVSYYYW